MMRNTNEMTLYKDLKKEFTYNIFDTLDEFTMSNTRILVVDDNPVNTYALSLILGKFNIRYDIAQSGEDAIKMFDSTDYDMIIIDYLMPPGLDGIETIRQIRNNSEKGKNQFIIGMSSAISEQVTDRFHSLDVDIILSKPVSSNQLAVIFKREFPDKCSSCLKIV